MADERKLNGSPSINKDYYYYYYYNADLLDTLAFPPMNSRGGGLQKIKIFCNVRFV